MMNQRVTEFMQDWMAENVHFIGYPAEDGIDPEAESLAIECAAAAEAEGLSEEELEHEYGDLASFLHKELERLADEAVGAKVEDDKDRGRLARAREARRRPGSSWGP
jgi:hypothetical protein